MKNKNKYTEEREVDCWGCGFWGYTVAGCPIHDAPKVYPPLKKKRKKKK